MKEENKIVIIITAVLISFTGMISCDRANVYSHAEKIPGYSWDADNIIEFEPYIGDTESVYDINMVIRSDRSYPYRNIFLFIKTTSPQGISINDTLEYYLADEKGNWYGSGLGDINALTVPFKNSVKFPLEGTYTFKVRHGMRAEDLEGITDIGLHIIKQNK